MRIIERILRRPLGTLIICMCLGIFGMFAFAAMPINLYPRAEFPVLTITTVLSDSSAEEIEILITEQIEDTLADIVGVRKISSASREGQSEITVQFHYGQNISEKALEVRSRLRRLFPLLPKDARFPIITRYDPSSSPVMVLAVVPKVTLEAASQWVYSTLKQQLSRIDGVATVKIAGAPKPQITVDCDASRLHALSLTIGDVAAAIRKGHQSMSAGFLISQGKHLSIVTEGKLETPAEIAEQPVNVPDSRSVYKVGDLGRVEIATEPPRELAGYNGHSLISVAIYRSTDADLRGLCKSVRQKIDEINSNPDSPASLDVITSQADELETVLKRLTLMICLTAGITALVLFAFLRNLRATAVVLSAIPFSLLLTFLFMKLFGVTLDLLSLGGLAMGIGILVDNSIVVQESISRCVSEARDVESGLLTGVEEVAAPLILSTLSTVVVFVPVFFISSEIRLLFKSFAWTVIASLTAALIASVMLIPVLYGYIGRLGREPSRVLSDYSRVYPAYSRALAGASKHKMLVFLLVLAFVATGVFFSRGLSFREALMSENNDFRVFMVGQPGISRERMATEIEKVEKLLLAIPGVKGVLSEARGNQARLTVTVERIRDSAREKLGSQEVKNQLQEISTFQFHVLPVVQQRDEVKISVKLHGPSHESLASIQDELRGALSRIDGIKDVLIQRGNPSPIVNFDVDHETVGFRGITGAELAHALRGHLTGPIAARLTGGDKITEVRVRAYRQGAEGLGTLDTLGVRNWMQGVIPFPEVVQPSVRMIDDDLTRENRRPVLKTTILLSQGDILGVSDKIKNAVEKLAVPKGLDFGFGDEITEVTKTRREMLLAAITGLVLIYLVLVVATESLSQPFLIMTAVPLGAAAAAIGLKTLGISVSLPVYVGALILAGLIVNVNVVMVYTMNRIRERGQSADQASFAGAARRVRAISMTVIVTFASSLPMLLDNGAGSSLWSPFAWTIACGIMAAGLLSLILTPLLYSVTVSSHRGG